MALPVIHPWQIELEGPVTDYSESIFAIGNGRMGVRGFSLQTPKAAPQEHGFYRAGFFEPVKPGITDMVQLPDVLGMAVEGFEPETPIQQLDLRHGILTQRWQAKGLAVSTERMLSMADRQLICVRMTLRSETERTLVLRAGMNDRVANLPVCDDQMLEETQTVRLLETVSHTDCELVMRASHSGRLIRFMQTLFVNGRPVSDAAPRLTLHAKEPAVIEKRIRVLMDDEAENTQTADPWAAHGEAWEALWQDCDIDLDADDAIQGALRWNLFQLLCSSAWDDPAISIGARGLTHGRYKGNAFWDTDIFLLPFYCWHRPEAARNLMEYRVRHLPEARKLARKQNLDGARYPWMCAMDGDEQCESWDIGLCETHVTADVAYALQRMLEITGAPVTGGMRQLFADTARYWKSRFTWEEGKQQYSSFFVKGPDEYCGAAVNNTYTNYMARHNAELALAYAGELLSDQERGELKFFADHVTLLYDAEKALYQQDELFDRLEPLPAGRTKGEPLYRTVCFDRMQRYRALKQADLVQLMVLFPHAFSEKEKRAVWEKYEPLTVHDSSLSFGVHAHLAFQLGLKDKGWDYFTRSLFFDLRDMLHNTGREGVHMASLGATWQALVYGMLGLWAEDGKLSARARLPREIRSVSLAVWYRGEKYRITAANEKALIEKEGQSFVYSE